MQRGDSKDSFGIQEPTERRLLVERVGVEELRYFGAFSANKISSEVTESVFSPRPQI